MESALGAPRGTSGYATLEQLSYEGWTIEITRQFAGGLRATAKRGEVLVEAVGATVEQLAPFLLERTRRAAA